MEKIKKMSKKNSEEVVPESKYLGDPKEEGEELMSQDDLENLQRMSVIGWDNAMACANDLWSSIHRSLLKGELVFAYKSGGTGNTGFGQIVVVQNLNHETGRRLYDDYGVGLITSGYTALLPHVPYSYLENDILEDLKKFKVESRIIDIYKQIIKTVKKIYG